MQKERINDERYQGGAHLLFTIKDNRLMGRTKCVSGSWDDRVGEDDVMHRFILCEDRSNWRGPFLADEKARVV